MVHKVNVRIRICLRGDTIIGTTRELLAARRAISVKVNVLASFLKLKNDFACSIKFMTSNLRYGNSENSVDFSKFFRQNRPRNRNQTTTLCFWGFILIFALSLFIERGGTDKVPNLIVYFWMQLR